MLSLSSSFAADVVTGRLVTAIVQPEDVADWNAVVLMVVSMPIVQTPNR
jgi:hypothetical protein